MSMLYADYWRGDLFLVSCNVHAAYMHIWIGLMRIPLVQTLEHMEETSSIQLYPSWSSCSAEGTNLASRTQEIAPGDLPQHQPSPRHLTPPARTGSGLPSVGCCNLWIWNCCWMQPRPRSCTPCLSMFVYACPNFTVQPKKWKVGKMYFLVHIHIHKCTYTLYISFSNNMWKICT